MRTRLCFFLYAQSILLLLNKCRPLVALIGQLRPNTTVFSNVGHTATFIEMHEEEMKGKQYSRSITKVIPFNGQLEFIDNY